MAARIAVIHKKNRSNLLQPAKRYRCRHLSRRIYRAKRKAACKHTAHYQIRAILHELKVTARANKFCLGAMRYYAPDIEGVSIHDNANMAEWLRATAEQRISVRLCVLAFPYGVHRLCLCSIELVGSIHLTFADTTISRTSNTRRYVCLHWARRYHALYIPGNCIPSYVAFFQSHPSSKTPQSWGCFP